MGKDNVAILTSPTPGEPGDLSRLAGMGFPAGRSPARLPVSYIQ